MTTDGKHEISGCFNPPFLSSMDDLIPIGGEFFNPEMDINHMPERQCERMHGQMNSHLEKAIYRIETIDGEIFPETGGKCPLEDLVIIDDVPVGLTETLVNFNRYGDNLF